MERDGKILLFTPLLIFVWIVFYKLSPRNFEEGILTLRDDCCFFHCIS